MGVKDKVVRVRGDRNGYRDKSRVDRGWRLRIGDEDRAVERLVVDWF